MRVERLDEPVSCRAEFARGGVTPVSFTRHGREHRVTQVHARWVDRSGRHPQHYFSAQCDAGEIYELRLDAGEMQWHVQSVLLEG
ncbi:MAG TPA: hypothetical protein VMS93_03735 [Candidatus Saccharimonadales bacterium]|nr:hypothetical protein [Candidatus Saccharimonadales bacterium]